ncbi:MAG: restriction endonuclease subunit R, partial [Deltaproteobacteria bacterium]|nr:restriction endonuclease subunit R [Deltaproteobacteria bacterium]
LPLGDSRLEEIDYEGRHLLTDEVVEKMKIRLPLLESGIGAISYYREELEHITGLRGTHKILAPLLETFLTEILFEERVTLFDDRLLSRLADSDVREHIRATFVPLILARTTIKEERRPRGQGVSVSSCTLFNLVPCNREFEVAMTQFLDHAPDVKAFCKNSGPQALRIDYLSQKGRLSLYTPDFIARLNAGVYVLIETKGREDRDVPLKVRAAVAWCEAASQGGGKWTFLYVPQKVFEEFSANKLKMLILACEPALKQILDEILSPQLSLPFGEPQPEAKKGIAEFLDTDAFNELPSRYQKAIEQAVTLFRFMQNKDDVSFAPVFTPLLGPVDEAARGLIMRKLQDEVPSERSKQYDFFRPDLSDLTTSKANYLKNQARNLERTLVDQNGLMPIGLLRFCLEYASGTKRKIGGVFAAVRSCFADAAGSDLLLTVNQIYDFRNQYVAHQEMELSDPDLAQKALIQWANGLHKIWRCR